MTYRKPHLNCKESCKTYTAYIRIKNKWTPVGEYNTECKTFGPLQNPSERRLENESEYSDKSYYDKILKEEANELEKNLPILINSLF